MDTNEIRLRCVEAAAKAPMTHAEGYAKGVTETAAEWAAFILQGAESGAAQDKCREVLGLPKKR